MTTMTELKRGDIVTLRQGGLRMTVATANLRRKHSGDIVPAAQCIWLSNEGILQAEVIPTDCLKIAVAQLGD